MWINPKEIRAWKIIKAKGEVKKVAVKEAKLARIVEKIGNRQGKQKAT